MVLLYLVALYIVIGAIVAAAFVSVGVTQTIPYSMTPGARVLILPGAIALWPYVLMRWLQARAAQ